MVDWRPADVADHIAAFEVQNIFGLRQRGKAVNHVWPITLGIAGSTCRLSVLHSTPTAFAERFATVVCTTPVLACRDARTWYEAVAEARRRHPKVPLTSVSVFKPVDFAVLSTRDGTLGPSAYWPGDDALCTASASFSRVTETWAAMTPWPVD